MLRPKDVPDISDYGHPANYAPAIITPPPPRDGWTVDEQRFTNGSVLCATLENGAEGFLLSDRPFELIDRSSRYKLMAMLIKQLKQHPDRNVRVLDFGGGMNSLAMRGILKHPMFKNRVSATNIDLFGKSPDSQELATEGVDPSKLRVICGDAFEWDSTQEDSEHGGEGFDLILAWESINKISGPKVYPAIEKCAKMLAPGGEMIARDDRLAGRSGMDPWMVLPLFSFPGMYVSPLQRIANDHDVMMVPSFCEETFDGRLVLFGAGAGLLLMRKTDPEHPMVSPKDYGAAFPEIQTAVEQHERWWENVSK